MAVKTNDRDHTIADALQHALGTHLSKAGAPLRTAQAAMGHGDSGLTANVYTEPKLLEVAGAMASLPELLLVAGSDGCGLPRTSATRRCICLISGL